MESRRKTFLEGFLGTLFPIPQEWHADERLIKVGVGTDVTGRDAVWSEPFNPALLDSEYRIFYQDRENEMMNPLTALKALKEFYDTKKAIAAAIKEARKGSTMNEEKVYSYGKGAWKGIIYLVVTLFGVGAGIEGKAALDALQAVSLPDSWDVFVAAWPTYVVPILVGLGKFVWNYIKQKNASA